ncbi:MAG: hypothetical protein J5714_02660 [Alphaproteobacteria bacterium]|nr:hypothetical protein [Alphaproteobacteria bacterium]
MTNKLIWLVFVITIITIPASAYTYKPGVTGTGWEYVDWDKVSWWNKQVIGIGYANCKLKIALYEKKLAYHQAHSDATKIARAELKLKAKEKYCRENTRPYESDFWNEFAEAFPLLVLMFVVAIIFLLRPIVRRIFSPKLWRHARKAIKTKKE